MAVCRVVKSVEGWKVGDHIEAFKDRLTQLVDSGVIVVEIPDEQEEVKVQSEDIQVKEVEVVMPKKGRPKKGVK